jgi:hypothetical protein
VPYAIPEILPLLIRRVGDPPYGAGSHVTLERVSSQLDKRATDVRARCVQRGKAARPCAAHRAHQDCLDLVVPRVSGHDDTSDATSDVVQKIPTRITPRCLAATHQGGVSDNDLKLTRRGRSTHERSRARGVRAGPMIERRHRSDMGMRDAGRRIE